MRGSPETPSPQEEHGWGFGLTLFTLLLLGSNVGLLVTGIRFLQAHEAWLDTHDIGRFRLVPMIFLIVGFFAIPMGIATRLERPIRTGLLALLAPPALGLLAVFYLYLQWLAFGRWLHPILGPTFNGILLVLTSLAIPGLGWMGLKRLGLSFSGGARSAFRPARGRPARRRPKPPRAPSRKERVQDPPATSREVAPVPTEPAEGIWYPLELERHWGERQGSVQGSRRFGGLWLSATEAAPGETLQLRVRLQPALSLRLQDFSVMLVVETPASLDEPGGRVLHSERIMMHTDRVVRGGEQLEFPPERVTLPQGGLIDREPELRWYLKVESRLQKKKELFLQELPLSVRLRPARSRPPPLPALPLLPEDGAPAALASLTENEGEDESLPGTRAPVSEDIRRKLEGGIETLETAHLRYTLLKKALSRRSWQEAVLHRLGTLRQALHQEPEVEQALTRLQQRAEGEGWRETEPALVLARKVEELRLELEGLTHGHPGLLPEAGGARLAEKLERLERLLTRMRAPPVSPEELVLHHAPSMALYRGRSRGRVLVPVLGLIYVIALLVSPGLLRGLVTALLLLLPVLWYGRMAYHSGPFWLTQKRLVFKPLGRAALHLPLEALRPGGVRHLSSNSVELEWVDGRTLRLERPHARPKRAIAEETQHLLELLKQHAPGGP